MILADAVAVAFRSDSPALILRGTDTVIALRPAKRGAAVTPTAASCVVTDAGGAVVATLTADLTEAGVAKITVAGTDTAELPAGDGWRLTWAVTLPGETNARTMVKGASLVLRYLYPVIDDQDLFDRISALDPSRPDCITHFTDYAKPRSEAWGVLMGRLVGQNRRPWLIVSAEDFRESHLNLTLALIFDDLKSRLNAAYKEQAQQYRDEYERAWTAIRMIEEPPSASGTLTGSAIGRRGVKLPIFLGGR